MKYFKIELFCNGIGITLGKYAIGIITKSLYGKKIGDWYVIRYHDLNKTFNNSILISYYRLLRKIPINNFY